MSSNLARPRFYVYRIFDGPTTVYVGKGSGTRLRIQIGRFGLPGEIIESCRSDDHAFERERHWIKSLRPTDNRHPGGNGGRRRPKPKARMASPASVARYLLLKLYPGNIAEFGVSMADYDRLIEVAGGR
jgi:hypothetical protein